MERNIFKFHDGQKDRAADPIAVYRAIHSHPSVNVVRAVEVIHEANQLIAKEGEEAAAKKIDQAEYWNAYGQIVRATASALEVSLWSESNPDGMTEEMVFELYNQFSAFSDAQKKTAAPSPISPPVTEPELLPV